MYVKSETAVLANISIAMVINRRVERGGLELTLDQNHAAKNAFLHRRNNQLEG